ncbi:MAG: Asp-tRNA(Asn)/Glu-tRNA(Gln) amidotransferase subunit GatA [Spirochaetia bacterium]|nr:Asp-tRNA(Asn)/Glu-tRNA(Gln) amidotransferase subunit GatA [Spirochaetota bacterium]MCX8096840.1 Asp-tRNA(Asn)/Glu-tRNA(Gln) amidotransferase subunit GatA [Spirochaetota bacterium]MDW8112809.1 Asp-tRNA(Asn)/Glu-tRNA(Gln) amidotransferase subunit GatA [Spirochaetia bacterium]
MNLTITSTIKGLKEKKFSCQEIVNYYLNKIKQDNSSDKPINGFISLNEEEALKTAKYIDENIDKIDGKLLGVPLGIKDNINIKGLPTTCASKILEGYIAVEDATVIDKIRKEGGIFIGKTNLDEFAMGSSTETSYYGIVRNPHDRERVPGGSSGGSAAAVASDMVVASLGSDTGGSIRQPSAFCGTVGLKPTYGLVSRYGLVAFGSSLDQIGPITKNVEDCAILLEVISGYDPKDSTSVKVNNTSFSNYIHKTLDPSSITIGLPQEYFTSDVQKEISESIQEVVNSLSKKGVKVKNISLPRTKYAIPTYYIVAPAEASSNLARFDGIRYGFRKASNSLRETYFETRAEGFGKEVKRRIMLGNYVLSAGYYDAYYLKALKVRTLLKQDFDNAFKDVDFIITPTTPTTAFKIGEKTSNPIEMYLSDIFTVTINLVGTCAIVLPVGKDNKNLPIGMQIIGKPFEDGELLRFAYFVESLLK